MPTTGTEVFQVKHLGDIYGFILGGIALGAGVVLASGWAIRRRAVSVRTEE